MSLDEFTDWALTQDRKYEYYQGVVRDVYPDDGVALPDNPAARNTVAGNVFAALHGLLKGRQCQAFVADMMVRVEADNVGYYPDVLARGPCPSIVQNRSTADRRSVVAVNRRL